jgi:hypothetical protein
MRKSCTAGCREHASPVEGKATRREGGEAKGGWIAQLEIAVEHRSHRLCTAARMRLNQSQSPAL